MVGCSSIKPSLYKLGLYVAIALVLFIYRTNFLVYHQRMYIHDMYTYMEDVYAYHLAHIFEQGILVAIVCVCAVWGS